MQIVVPAPALHRNFSFDCHFLCAVDDVVVVVVVVSLTLVLALFVPSFHQRLVCLLSFVSSIPIVFVVVVFQMVPQEKNSVCGHQ